MKRLFLSFFLLLSVCFLHAQTATNDYSVASANFLNVGVGVGSYYKGLPFGVSYEHGFTDAISGGVFASYSTYNYSSLNFKMNI